jgi:hypothetical protein
VDCVERMLNTSSKNGMGENLTPGGPRREAASLEIHCFLWDPYSPCGQCVSRLRWMRDAIGRWTSARGNVPIIDELTRSCVRQASAGTFLQSD